MPATTQSFVSPFNTVRKKHVLSIDDSPQRLRNIAMILFTWYRIESTLVFWCILIRKNSRNSMIQGMLSLKSLTSTSSNNLKGFKWNQKRKSRSNTGTINWKKESTRKKKFLGTLANKTKKVITSSLAVITSMMKGFTTKVSNLGIVLLW